MNFRKFILSVSPTVKVRVGKDTRMAYEWLYTKTYLTGDPVVKIDFIDENSKITSMEYAESTETFILSLRIDKEAVDLWQD